MKFPQEFIDRVRESSNLVDIVGQYVQLRKNGGNHQGLCPFHNEKSPSFSVSEDKQVYHCFGCKASGNVFTFVQNYQGMTFPETIEYLAQRAGLPIPEDRDERNHGERDVKTILLKINSLACQYFHAELKRLSPDHEVKKYLVKRGLSDVLVDTYKLGYAPEGWTGLADFFARRKVPLEPSEQLGLLKRRTGGKSGHYDLFRHRLMFPIFSPTGQCLGFGGRVFTSDQQPKYLNSPDSPVFHKGKVFYGLDTSAKFIRNEDEIIVVEGYMDWLALAKVGIGNIAATLGTALTHEHAKVIKRYTNKVLLLFDGDAAGKNAARRSLPILLGEGLHVRGLFLPDELDPDEFIQERGVAELKTLIQSAPDLFDLVTTEQWMTAKGSPTAKVQILDDYAPILALTQDPRLKRLYAQNLANLLDINIRLVEQSVTAGAVKGPTGARPTISTSELIPPKSSPTSQEAVIFDLTGAPRAEVELLNVIQLKEVYLKEALAAGIEDQFSHPGTGAVFRRMAEVYRLMPNKFDTLSASLTTVVRPVETITRHLSESYAGLSEDGVNKLLQDCIKRVKEKYLRMKSKELVSGLKATTPAESQGQLEQIMNIHKNRRSLNRDS